MTTAAPTTESNVPTTTAAAEIPPEELYAQGRAVLGSAENMTLDLVITTYRTVAGDEYSEQSAQTLTYQRIGTAESAIAMSEDLTFSVHNEDYDPNSGDHAAYHYEEIWYQGTVYAAWEDTYLFSGPVDAEEIAFRYASVVLLDAALKDVRRGRGGDFPRQLQNMHADTYTQERSQGYLYPHDFPNHWVKQQYLPDDLVGTRYYEYGPNKTEQAAKAYWDSIKGK